MFPVERRNEILRIVQQRGTIKIAELSTLLKVSEMTIHRDLLKLEASGLLEKSYGGVQVKHSMTSEPDFRTRARESVPEKNDIGLYAAQFVNDGDSLLVDASTTILYFVRHLKPRRDLTLIMTGLNPQMEIASFEGMTVYVAGGMLSRETGCYVGPHVTDFLTTVHADKCFIGANSIDVEHGVTDPYYLESEVKRRMVTASEQVFLLADHTKFGRVSMHKSFPLSQIDMVITDGRAPNPCLEEFDKIGLQYRIAPARAID